MADAVNSITLYDGPHNAVLHFTNKSDGTGESLVQKVDVAALLGSNTKLYIEKIVYGTNVMAVEIYSGGAANVLLEVIPPNYSGEIEFCGAGYQGGLPMAGASPDGTLKFTTRGHTATATYAITLFLRKGK